MNPKDNSPLVAIFKTIFLVGMMTCALIQTMRGQVASNLITTPPISQSTTGALADAFQSGQQTLVQERQALIYGGATRQQLAAWMRENGSRIAAQQQLAQQIALSEQMKDRPTNLQAFVSAGESSEIALYRNTAVSLANARALIHNQIVQQLSASGQMVTIDQLRQMESHQFQIFRQQHADEISAQIQSSLAMIPASTQKQIQLPLLTIPTGSSPQMAAYLTAKYQIFIDRMRLAAQYAGADSHSRQIALALWRQQNATRINQVQAQAQALDISNAVDQYKISN